MAAPHPDPLPIALHSMGRGRDDPIPQRAVRRLRLRHAAVPADRGPVGHARHDELRQSRALLVRDDRRLRDDHADAGARLAVSRHACRWRSWPLPSSASCWSACCSSGFYRATDLDQCLAHDRHRVRVDRRRGLPLWHHAAVGEGAVLPQGLDQRRRHHDGRLSPVPDRDRADRSPSPWSCSSRRRGLARAFALRSTTSVWRAGSASTSTASSR